MAGIEIAAARGHDRTHHQDLKLVGRRLRVARPGLLGKPCEDLPDHVEMAYGGGMDRAVDGLDLEQRLDERTALVVAAAKPLVEQIEDRERALAGGRRQALDPVLEPLLRPTLFAQIEEG